MDLDQLKFDENGLIPCIVQDFYSGSILMLAWMNRESIGISLDKKRTCFWSRSRQELWLKGETSGNVQNLVSLTADCDADALVAKVIREGPACHTGEDSCFYQSIFKDDTQAKLTLSALYTLLQGRRTTPVEGSYTNYLFDKGREKILKKVGEECSEVLIASMKDDKQELIYEISDLCYHILVLMVHSGITIEEIQGELDSRHVVDSKVKQETGQ